MPSSLLAIALAHVEEHGLPELTMRKLAARAGVSIATITHHLGPKDALLAALVSHAHVLDQDVFAAWEVLTKAASGPAERRRIAAEAAFSLTIHRREQATLYAELIRTGPHPVPIETVLRDWDKSILDFWTAMCGCNQLGAILHAYLVDETAFELALDHLPAYRALRRLNIDRLTGNLPEALAGGRNLFGDLFTSLAPADSVLEAINTVQPDLKRQEVAAAAARLIVDKGTEAVTHRSVAAVSGHAPSSVVYFFGARTALIIAGLEHIIREMHAGINSGRPHVSLKTVHTDPDRQSAIRPVVRATNEIAVASRRHEGLKPHAGDMRRRRGENITASQLRDLPALEQAFSALLAQCLSIAMFGARLRAVALGDDPASATGSIMTAMDTIIFSEQSLYFSVSNP